MNIQTLLMLLLLNFVLGCEGPPTPRANTTPNPKANSTSQASHVLLNHTVPVSNVTIREHAQGPELTERQFTMLYSNGKSLLADDPLLSGWHCFPWCTVLFNSGGKAYTARLYLDGVVTWTNAENEKGAFTFSSLPKGRPN